MKLNKYHYSYKTNYIVRFFKLVFSIFYLMLFLNEIIHNNISRISTYIMFNCPRLCVKVIMKILLFYIYLYHCYFKLL